MNNSQLLLSNNEQQNLYAAREQAQKILCQHNNGCNTCKTCKLLQSETHPDLYFLTAIDNNQITIENIRELIASLNTKANYKNKVAIIHGAHKLNLAAANALLKILEEPGPNTYFILTTKSAKQLLPTILSRLCITKLKEPNFEELLLQSNDKDNFNKFCELLAKIADLNSFDGVIAGDKDNIPLDKALYWMLITLRDIVFWYMANKAKDSNDNPALQYIKANNIKLDLDNIFKLYDLAYNKLRKCQAKYNLNYDLNFEQLCLAWQQLFIKA